MAFMSPSRRFVPTVLLAAGVGAGAVFISHATDAAPASPGKAGRSAIERPRSLNSRAAVTLHGAIAQLTHARLTLITRTRR